MRNIVKLTFCLMMLIYTPMQPETNPLNNRIPIMNALRAHGASDEEIGQLFELSRQRVHVLLGARPTPEESPPPIKFNEGAKDLPAALIDFRTRHDLSQGALANLLGLPPDPNGKNTAGTIWRWENGYPCKWPHMILRLLELIDDASKNNP
jgi:hypothetical protein